MKKDALWIARAAVVAAAVAALLAACGAADVVGAKAPGAFAAALSRVAAGSRDGTWEFAFPDGERLLVSAAAGKGALEVSLDAAPFLEAGLDAASLGGGPLGVGDGRLVARGDLPELGSGAALGKPEEAIALIASKDRGRIGWHEALDHYGIPVVPGLMAEWARDKSSNDKDFVFVIDPALLPGLDPAGVRGWKYADVDTKDGSGRPAKVKRLLKPYDLGS